MVMIAVENRLKSFARESYQILVGLIMLFRFPSLAVVVKEEMDNMESWVSENTHKNL